MCGETRHQECKVHNTYTITDMTLFLAVFMFCTTSSTNPKASCAYVMLNFRAELIPSQNIFVRLQQNIKCSGMSVGSVCIKMIYFYSTFLKYIL